MHTLLSSRSKFCLLALLSASLICGLVSARAETTSASGAIEITAVPCSIDQSGTYFLKQDFAVSNQTAITITAANVTLDLNGHTLTNTCGAATTAHAIYVIGDNVNVHGGRTSGFFYGVTTVGNSSRIEDVTVAQAYYIGICSYGKNNCLRRCRVCNVGGTTYFGPSTNGYGLIVANDNVRVLDCDVCGVAASGSGAALGIYHSSNAGMETGNRVRDCQFGLYILYGSGIKYRDNICAGVGTPYNVSTAAIDAGGNN